MRHRVCTRSRTRTDPTAPHPIPSAQDYFGDRLPRLPVLIQRQIDSNLRDRDDRARGAARERDGMDFGSRADACDVRGGNGGWREGRADRKRPAGEHDEWHMSPQAARLEMPGLLLKKEEIARMRERCRALRDLIAAKERSSGL